mmetsp:Transcript_26348/g.63524  ORF Transcript_26348/g.63524 Transcript_26348/m.63524 type:complete len:492 (-) Transcript_26348:142-1617(-)
MIRGEDGGVAAPPGSHSRAVEAAAAHAQQQNGQGGGVREREREEEEDRVKGTPPEVLKALSKMSFEEVMERCPHPCACATPTDADSEESKEGDEATTQRPFDSSASPLGVAPKILGLQVDSEAEDKMCEICQVGYDADDEVLLLPCKHFFHTSCVSRWLGMRRTCPKCRHAVAPLDGTPAEEPNGVIVRRTTTIEWVPVVRWVPASSTTVEVRTEVGSDMETVTTTTTRNTSIDPAQLAQNLSPALQQQAREQTQQASQGQQPRQQPQQPPQQPQQQHGSIGGLSASPPQPQGHARPAASPPPAPAGSTVQRFSVLSSAAMQEALNTEQRQSSPPLHPSPPLHAAPIQDEGAFSARHRTPRTASPPRQQGSAHPPMPAMPPLGPAARIVHPPPSNQHHLRPRSLSTDFSVPMQPQATLQATPQATLRDQATFQATLRDQGSFSRDPVSTQHRFVSFHLTRAQPQARNSPSITPVTPPLMPGGPSLIMTPPM